VRAPRAAALIAALALGACGGSGSESAQRPGCPSGLILADASAATVFRDGAGRDLTDILAQIRIADLAVDCKIQRQSVTVDLQVAIAAERGPANAAGRQEVGYFVALVDPAGQIRSRQGFSVGFAWPENRLLVGAVEEFEPRIAIAAPEEAARWSIWVGLQLTEEQLRRNRAAASGRR